MLTDLNAMQKANQWVTEGAAEGAAEALRIERGAAAADQVAAEVLRSQFIDGKLLGPAA